MKRLRSALVLAALASPVLADDPAPPTPPAPTPAPEEGPKPEPAPAAKKERRVDEAGTKALARHNALVHSPANSGFKELAAKGELEQMGMSIGMNPHWTAEKGFDLQVELPEQLKAMAEAQGSSEDDMKKGIAGQISGLLGLSAAFETVGRTWAHFDIASKQSGDDTVVELTAFDDQAEAESRTYVFGKDGLLRTTSMTRKSDPNDPMTGMTIDVTLRFEKRGERHALVGRDLSIRGQEVSSAFAYFDGTEGAAFVKSFTISAQGTEQTIAFHDYVVDGKAVEATKAAAAEKPAEAPLKKSDEKPSAEPPAPQPPAPEPKDEK